MNPDRWEKISGLYHEALKLKADERAAFLKQACSGDEELRREAESLLALDQQAEDFIESPALEKGECVSRLNLAQGQGPAALP